MTPALYIVVPCCNEEEALPSSADALASKLEDLSARDVISSSSKVLFVDDGSKDGTWAIIDNLVRENPVFTGLKLSRNEGHQNALMAGMEQASRYADAIITIDADLQDDVNAIDEMVEHFNQGFEVVYGVRNDRSTDGAFKRGTAHMFYGLQRALGAECVYDHADFRLLSARAVKALLQFPERNLFLRGMVPLIGFNSCSVYYARSPRTAGTTKYGFGKMCGLAIDGITSFSIKPMRLIMTLGIVALLISFVLIIYIVYGWANGGTVGGWPSLMVSVWLLGGLNLFALGIVGEYVGKAYIESKARPRYFIAETIGFDKNEESDAE